MLKNLAKFCLLAVPFVANAIDDTGITLSEGRPDSEQNKDIAVWDFGVERKVGYWEDDIVTTGLTARIGQMKLDEESGLRAGIGAFIGKDIGWVSLSIPVGIVWIEKSEFGAQQLSTKNYGGKMQFTIGGEMAFNMPGDWQLFYRFEHMSNGNRYEYNPALNSHNVGFKLHF